MAFLGKHEVFGELSFREEIWILKEETWHFGEETLLSSGEAWLFGKETRLSGGTWLFKGATRLPGRQGLLSPCPEGAQGPPSLRTPELGRGSKPPWALPSAVTPPERCEGVGQALPPPSNVEPSTPGLSRPEGPVPPPRFPGKCPARGSRTVGPLSPAAGPGRAGPGPQGCGRRGRCVAPVTAPTGAAIFPPRPPAAAPAAPAAHCAGAGPPLETRDDGEGVGRGYGRAMMGRSSLLFAAQRGGRHVWMVHRHVGMSPSAMLGEAGGRGRHVREVDAEVEVPAGVPFLFQLPPCSFPVSHPHPQPREAQLGHGVPLCPQGSPSAPAAALPCPCVSLRDLEPLRAQLGAGCDPFLDGCGAPPPMEVRKGGSAAHSMGEHPCAGLCFGIRSR